MSWLHYLVEANIYLGVFYLCYCLFLNRDTHYTLSRVYLIFSCIVSFMLPLTQLSILKPVEEVVILPPAVIIPNNPVTYAPAQIAAPVQHVTLQDALVYAYAAGAIIACLILLFRLRKLYILTRRNHSLHQDQYKLINLTDENTAFSFFNYLFIGNNIPQAETIIAHELVHIRQKHSFDIIFLEMLKVINWFNPFVYLVQRSLKTIHEYIADEQTAAHEQDALAYSSFLLNNAYGIQGASIAHSFFNYNLLKKRIIMLNQKRSGKLARLKYLAAIPLCAGMLCTSTLLFSKDYGVIELAPRKAVAVKPAHIKYFRMTDDDLITYADNVSFTKKGITKTYKAATATDADLAYILKVHKLKIEIIMVDSKTYKPIVPAAVTENLQTDTGRVKFLPPTVIKDAFSDFGRYLRIKTVYPKAAFDSKKQGGIIISFYVNGSGTISDVKLLDNPGIGFDNAALTTAKTYRGKIKTKAGEYKMGVNFRIFGQSQIHFPAPSATKDANYVGEIDVVGMTEAQRKQLVPPPPMAVPDKPAKVDKMPPPMVVPDKPAKVGSTPPPPPRPKIKDQIKLPPSARPKVKDQIKFPPPVVKPDKQAKAPAVTQVNKMPPPPPNDPAYSDLLKYIAKNTRFPTIAREKKVTGNIIVSLRFDNDHKITDIKLEKGIGYGCDEELIRALKTYDKTIHKPAGAYKLAATFTMVDDKDKQVNEPKPIDDSLLDSENFIGQIVMVAYSK